MPDCMTFPDAVEEFMEQYKVVDTEQVYTNGTEFVPIYRMRQWFQHEPERKKGKWTKDCACGICGFKPWYERDIHTLSFCPNCGADLREDQDDQSKR